MSNLLEIESAELKALEPSKAQSIKDTFEPMAKMLSEFESQFEEVVKESQSGITIAVCAKAKRVRLDIGKVRIETGKIKDRQKEYIKLEDRAIMGVHNILVWAVKEKEDKLKEIEDYFETQEKLRIEALQSLRVEKLSLYVEDANQRDLAKFADDEFEALLSMKKKEFEDRIAAEKKAEEDRIAKEKAEAEERERIRLENEQLKKDAEERDRLAKIEADKRAKEDADRIAKEEAERKQRQEEEAKERAAYEAKIKAEREEKERVQKELNDKAEAERKSEEARLAQIQADLSKGDSDKVKDLISDLESIKSKYVFKSEKNKKMYNDVSTLVDKVINHINTAK